MHLKLVMGMSESQSGFAQDRCNVQARQTAEGLLPIELHTGSAPPPLALPQGDSGESTDFSPLEHSLGSISPPTSSGNTGSGGAGGANPGSRGAQPAGGDTPTSRWAPAAGGADVGVGLGSGADMAARSPGVEIVPLGPAGSACGASGAEQGAVVASEREHGGAGRRGRMGQWLARLACWRVAPNTLGNM